MKYFFILLICISASCGKGPVDMEQAVIKITAPSSGQDIRVNQVVSVQAVVTDNEALEEVEWQVIRDHPGGQSGTYVIKKSVTVSGKIFQVADSFTPSIAGTYAVLVLAEDRFSNTSSESYVFNVQ